MEQTQQQAVEAYTAAGAAVAAATAEWETARTAEVEKRMAMNAARTVHDQALTDLVTAAMHAPAPAVPEPAPAPVVPAPPVVEEPAPPVVEEPAPPAEVIIEAPAEPVTEDTVFVDEPETPTPTE